MVNENRKKIYHIWNTAYDGYQKTSWVFYILTLGTIMGNVFGIPVEGGVASFIFGFVFFYWAGNFHKLAQKSIQETIKPKEEAK